MFELPYSTTELSHHAGDIGLSSRGSSTAGRPNPSPGRHPKGKLALPEPYAHHIEIVDGKPALQAAVSHFVSTMYSARGLETSSEQTSSLLTTRTTTLAACVEDKVFATMTLGIDANRGLLADQRYRDQIDQIRRSGATVCEFTRLAIHPDYSSQRILANMFNVAFVLARQLHRAGELVMEVNPRHAPFYRRMLGCHIAGPETICPRVGAPAVLLHLSLDHVEGEIERYHAGQKGVRNLYRHSFPPPEQPHLLANLLGKAH